MPERTGLIVPRIKLPPVVGPKPTKVGSKFRILNPSGGEVFRMAERHPASAAPAGCSFRVIWRGGPYPKNVNIVLVDVKRRKVVAGIATGLPNVQPGQVGMTPSWSIPPDLPASDTGDASAPSVVDALGDLDVADHGAVYQAMLGLYRVYIEDTPRTTWAYSARFTIAWSVKG